MRRLSHDTALNQAGPENWETANRKNMGRRGINVYTRSDIQRVTGRGKDGELLYWGTEAPYFYLTLTQRIEMFRLSSPVFGVVSSRMNKLSGLDYTITLKKDLEDETVQDLRDAKNIYNELLTSTTVKDLTTKAILFKGMLKNMPDLRTDLSNFQPCLSRLKRRLKNYTKQSTEEVYDWLQEPNSGVSWGTFVKKYVFDLLIHGSTAIYKKTENGKLQNFDLLPGGTVYKLKEPYFSSVSGYIQVTPGYEEPQIYFKDEMIYSEYMPSSARNYSMIPLEALINKVSEGLLFDRLMADQADGTKPPEKMAIITQASPFGSIDGNVDPIPLDKDKQSRIETKLNTPLKNSIMTFSGNHVEILDLSRENTMGIQMARQKDIREDVAFVFNMSNMEINSSGADGTSGRSTSEAQMEIEQGKGTAPIAKSLSYDVNKGMLPYRYGDPAFVFEFILETSELKERQLDAIKLQNGEITINEIREKYNLDAFDDSIFDKPRDTMGGGEPGADANNPLYTTNT